MKNVFKAPLKTGKVTVSQSPVNLVGRLFQRRISALCTDMDINGARPTPCVRDALSFSLTECNGNSPVASLSCPTPMYRASLIPRIVPHFVCHLAQLPCQANGQHVPRIPTVRIALVERRAVSWLASRLLRLSPLRFIRPRRRLVDLLRGRS